MVYYDSFCVISTILTSGKIRMADSNTIWYSDSVWLENLPWCSSRTSCIVKTKGCLYCVVSFSIIWTLHICIMLTTFGHFDNSSSVKTNILKKHWYFFYMYNLNSLYISPWKYNYCFRLSQLMKYPSSFGVSYVWTLHMSISARYALFLLFIFLWCGVVLLSHVN